MSTERKWEAINENVPDSEVAGRTAQALHRWLKLKAAQLTTQDTNDFYSFCLAKSCMQMFSNSTQNST